MFLTSRSKFCVAIHTSVCIICMLQFNKLFSHFTLQVEFLNLSNVAAVQTRGSATKVYWTTHFRLELSQDCVTFCPELDAFGFNVVITFFIFRMLIRHVYNHKK